MMSFLCQIFKFFIIILAFIKTPIKAQSEVLHSGEISELLYETVPIVKCFFIVFGDFNHDQAKAACAARGSSLAFFNSQTEEKLVQRKLDWSILPGFFEHKGDKSVWQGQLWTSAKRRVDNGTDIWEWKPNKSASYIESKRLNESYAEIPRFIEDPYVASTLIPTSEQNCLVLRKGGWKPLSCNGSDSGDPIASKAGALCNIIARAGAGTDKDDNTRNFCGAPLVPYSKTNLAIPLSMQKRYFFLGGRFTWKQSEEACAKKGSQLASIKSHDEYDFISKNVNFNLVGYAAWIALKRLEGESRFEWIDGSPMMFSRFLPGSPKPEYDCVAYQRDSRGTMAWASASCSNNVMAALCEQFSIF